MASSSPAQKEEAAGVQVSFSDAMRERLNDMRQMSRAFKAHSQAVAEARKEEARQRIERIREQIKQLMMLVAAMGGLASKGVLRQIEQLARSLGQAASVLKEGGGGADLVGSAGAAQDPGGEGAAASGSSLTVSVETAAQNDAQNQTPQEGDAAANVASAEAVEADVSAEDAAAQAGLVPGQAAAAQGEDGEQAAAADAEEAQRAEQVAARRTEREQRREDAELIRKAVRELKALLALVQASMGPADEDSDKQVKRINQEIQASEKAAQSLSSGSFDISVGDGLAALGSISVTV